MPFNFSNIYVYAPAGTYYSSQAVDETFDVQVDAEQGNEYQSMLVLESFTSEIPFAPGTLSVSVAGGLPDDEFIFRIDNREVIRLEADEDGALELASVPVPDLRDGAGNPLLLPGPHTLQVIQGTAAASATFTIIEATPLLPTQVGEDAPPLYTPGSVQPTGVRRWVLQDLAPGGLGSWIMPMNPTEADPPPFIRELTAVPTVADVEKGGQFHVYEDAFMPVEWTFRGYAPSSEMTDQLEAFADLNRRFYLIDHRGRAWKVAFQDLGLEPRLVQIWNGEYTAEGHDYTATVMVMERDYVEV